MHWLSRQLPFAFYLIVLAFAAYGMMRSSAYRACISNHAQYLSHQANESPYAPSWTARSIKARVKCAADFTEHYHGPLTAIATLLLALFTISLWWATRGLLRHAPIVERGYVFGGCGGQHFTEDDTGKLVLITVQATHGNYGKTPAFVEKIAVERCLEKDLPPKPTYTHFFPVNDALIPGTIGRPINNVKHTFEAVDHQVYYGRIYYRDVITKNAHISSFIYRFSAKGGHEVMGDVHPDYWKWD